MSVLRITLVALTAVIILLVLPSVPVLRECSSLTGTICIDGKKSDVFHPQ